MIALPKRPSLNDCTALAVAIGLHLVVTINRSTYYTYNVTMNPGLCYYLSYIYIYIFILFLLLSRYSMKDGIFDRTA